MHVNNFTIIRNKIFYTTEKRMTSLLSNITKNIRYYKSDHFKMKEYLLYQDKWKKTVLSHSFIQAN